MNAKAPEATQEAMQAPTRFALECVDNGCSLAEVLDSLDDKPGCKGEWREDVARWFIHFQQQRGIKR